MAWAGHVLCRRIHLAHEVFLAMTSSPSSPSIRHVRPAEQETKGSLSALPSTVSVSPTNCISDVSVCGFTGCLVLRSSSSGVFWSLRHGCVNKLAPGSTRRGCHTTITSSRPQTVRKRMRMADSRRGRGEVLGVGVHSLSATTSHPPSSPREDASPEPRCFEVFVSKLFS
ncbi:hypothetical protein C0Q70_08207 [Pomacea canaliculata]|uniref:Uncharacterized protein n=1 Tax=Pomacea canaliculata TaxID=400727 RepID=A0A2T7PH64_POMCA|nr:hypothetical protein C0Q70_08207 [Pomacea canaliculata]